MTIIVKSKIWLSALSKALSFKTLLGLAKRYGQLKKQPMKTKVNRKIQQKFLKEFGKHIKELRKKCDMTQNELAEKCISDVSKISKVECGKYDFKISSLLILAKGLDVPAEDLLSFKDVNMLKNNILQAPDNEHVTN